MAIKILIDSASDISLDEAKHLGINLISLLVSFDKEEYYDGVDITPSEFYQKLIDHKELPKTSQVTAYRFEQMYKSLLEEDTKLLVITLSSKLSGTYQGAVVAAEKFKEQVYVVDSVNCCAGERLLCLLAMKLIEKGKSIEEIVNILNKEKSRIQIMAIVNTLEYLKKGGRISSTIAFAGELLSLKPVVALIDGEVKMAGKALGLKKAFKLLNKVAKNKGDIDFEMPYAIIYSGFDKSQVKKYKEYSQEVWQDKDDIPEYIMGATIGTHVGPGAVGLAFFAKK